MGPTIRHSTPGMCLNILFFFPFSFQRTLIFLLSLSSFVFSFFSSSARFLQLLLFFFSFFVFFVLVLLHGQVLSSSTLSFFLFSSLWFLFSASYYSSSFFLFLHVRMAEGFNFSCNLRWVFQNCNWQACGLLERKLKYQCSK